MISIIVAAFLFVECAIAAGPTSQPQTTYPSHDCHPEIFDKLPRAHEVLGDSDGKVRAQKILCLEKFGPAAIPILIKGLSDKNELVRKVAAIVIGQSRTAPEAKKALPILLNEKYHSTADIRETFLATAVLIDQKGENEKTIPLLKKALHDTDSEVLRVFAKTELNEICGHNPLACKKDFLKDGRIKIE